MYDRVITNTLKELSEKWKKSREKIKLSAARHDYANVLNRNMCSRETVARVDFECSAILWECSSLSRLRRPHVFPSRLLNHPDVGLCRRWKNKKSINVESATSYSYTRYRSSAHQRKMFCFMLRYFDAPDRHETEYCFTFWYISSFQKDVLWRERLYYKINFRKKHLCPCSPTLTPIKAIKRSSHVSVLWCYRVIWYNYDLCTISPLSYRFSWSWHTKTDHFRFYLSVLHAATWALCDDNDDDIVGGCMKVNRHQLL